MSRCWLSICLMLTVAIGFPGCNTSKRLPDQATKTTVSGTIDTLTQSQNGSFRYYGKIRLREPERYRGKDVELFVISHEKDVREYVGKTISASFETDDLTRSIEPHPDPFSLSKPEPQLSLELTNAAFFPIDYLKYETPVTVRGLVKNYQPEKNKDNLYFQFDMGFSGDMASVEISEPAKYRGLVIHVLVYEDLRTRSARRSQWSRVGSKVGFTVPESTLAWEPWGFTPVESLGDVTFKADSTAAKN